MPEQNNQPKRLYRSQQDKVLAGVCGGLGEYFNIDPIIFRVLFIALTIAGGAGLLIYIILAIIIPSKPGAGKASDSNNDFARNVKDNAQNLAQEIRQDMNGGRDRGSTRNIVGGIIVALGFLLLLNQILPRHWLRLDLFWPLLIVAIGFVILTRKV